MSILHFALHLLPQHRTAKAGAQFGHCYGHSEGADWGSGLSTIWFSVTTCLPLRSRGICVCISNSISNQPQRIVLPLSTTPCSIIIACCHLSSVGEDVLNSLVLFKPGIRGWCLSAGYCIPHSLDIGVFWPVIACLVISAMPTRQIWNIAATLSAN